MNSSDPKRRCGECTLCCRLLPVAEIGKPAGQKCLQQRATGCRVYATPEFPLGCGAWSCMWLADESLPLPRPDRAGYVLDPMPDFIEVEDSKQQFGSRVTIGVLQVWIDPKRPHAHRDPQLRAWLATRWETHDQIALVRYDSRVAIALLPPSLTGGQWLEKGATAVTEDHTPQQIRDALK